MIFAASISVNHLFNIRIPMNNCLWSDFVLAPLNFDHAAVAQIPVGKLVNYLRTRLFAVVTI